MCLCLDDVGGDIHGLSVGDVKGTCGIQNRANEVAKEREFY